MISFNDIVLIDRKLVAFEMSDDSEQRPRKRAPKRHKNIEAKARQLDNPEVDALVADIVGIEDINNNQHGASSIEQATGYIGKEAFHAISGIQC